MFFNNEKTRLKQGDTVAYDEKTGMVRFFRDKQPLLLKNGSAEIFFPQRDLNFLVLIRMLAETNALDYPSSMQEIVTGFLQIKNRQWTSYIF